MPGALQTTSNPLHSSPLCLLARWPDREPLAVLCSGRPGRRRVTVARPEGWIWPESLAALDQVWAAARADGAVLAGFISYEMGPRLEPAAAGDSIGRAHQAGSWPLMGFARCREWAVWEPREDGAGRWSGPLDVAGLAASGSGRAGGAGFSLGPLRSRTGQERYERDAAEVIERIRAGDVYQVNLAHQLAGTFSGSARGLFLRLAQAVDPWHGAHLELPRQGGAGGWGPAAVCSLSPELFLEYEPVARRVTTRPMKGTRPASGDPAELAAAAKDTAELNMIVDLMRNDLGRSCVFGSVRVQAPRVIERHGPPGAGGGGVLQATAEVSGVLREDVSFLESLGMAFAPGSVTGAPKIQAMRMIERLEPVARGPYCGSICELRPDGSAVCSVAIRTALIRGRSPLRGDSGGPLRPGRSMEDASAPAAFDPPTSGGPRCGWFDDAELTWSVGAGIVADSDPAAEWQETLDKAQVLVAHAETRIDD